MYIFSKIILHYIFVKKTKETYRPLNILDFFPIINISYLIYNIWTKLHVIGIQWKQTEILK